MAYLWHVSKIMSQFKLGGLIAHLEIVRNSTHVLAEWKVGEVANQRDDAHVGLSVLSALRWWRVFLHLPEAADEFPQWWVIHLKNRLQTSMCCLSVVVGAVLAVYCTFVHISHGYISLTVTPSKLLSGGTSLRVTVGKGAPLVFAQIVSTLPVKYLAKSPAVWGPVIDSDGLSNEFIWCHNDLESEQLFIELDQKLE